MRRLLFSCAVMGVALLVCESEAGAFHPWLHHGHGVSGNQGAGVAVGMPVVFVAGNGTTLQPSGGIFDNQLLGQVFQTLLTDLIRRRTDPAPTPNVDKSVTDRLDALERDLAEVKRKLQNGPSPKNGNDGPKCPDENNPACDTPAAAAARANAGAAAAAAIRAAEGAAVRNTMEPPLNPTALKSLASAVSEFRAQSEQYARKSDIQRLEQMIREQSTPANNTKEIGELTSAVNELKAQSSQYAQKSDIRDLEKLILELSKVKAKETK